MKRKHNGRRHPEQTEYQWDKYLALYQQWTQCSDPSKYPTEEQQRTMRRLTAEADLWQRYGYYPSDLVMIVRHGLASCVQPRGK